MKNDEGGIWRTVGGRRIFIKDGQDLESAMRESGKFSKISQEEEDKSKNEYKEIKNFDDDIKELENESDYAYEKARESKDIGALNSYTEEYYMDVNYYLRNGEYADNNPEYTKYVDDIIKGTDNAIKNYDLKENLIVYKGTSQEFYKDYNINDTFEMKEFNSTSINKEVANIFNDKEKPFLLEIKVPKGTSSMYLGKNSANSNEYELLIARNTSYKVLNKTETGMTLEVIKNVK